MAVTDMLNWQQACKILHCSRSHFYNLVNSGELASERSGRVKGVRVSRAECLRYMQAWRERLEGEAECAVRGEK